MKRTSVSMLVVLGLVATAGFRAGAGGRLETVDITANLPSPIAGHLLARVVGIQWDTRTLPVQYRVNDFTGASVPNPLGAPVLTLDQAAAALQVSLDAWNEIPTSFVRSQIVGRVTTDQLRGFDMVNELTFSTAASFSAIASSPSVSLIADTTFVNGDDIDGDGDSDVSNTIAVATDVDGDGDIEFPAGFYKAGTILDNDVQFNTKTSNGFRFTVGDAALDTVTRSVDLNTVATHEFGHSIGLSHSMINQTSGSDGDGATMFPFIDTGDPESERQQRTLHPDDIAWASYLYPEGTANRGLPALQKGDVAFGKAYGLIEGDARHGALDQPLVGASLVAVGDKKENMVSSGYSGTTNLSFNPATGGLFFVPDPAIGIVDGHYVIPVSKGNYSVGIEAVDGSPAAAGNISFTCQIGAFYGQAAFNEEFYTRRDDDVEARPGQAKNVRVSAGRSTDGIDITTNVTFNIVNSAAVTSIGFINSPAGRTYAVAIPAAQIAAFLPGEKVAVHSALFDTYLVDASTTPVFATAMITTGVINTDGTATIDTASPLDKEKLFVGQDGDSAPMFTRWPRLLANHIRRGIEQGRIQNVFLVLQIPTTTPYPGVSGQPPLVGLSTTAPINGLSFVSDDGITFNRLTTANIRFSMVLSERP